MKTSFILFYLLFYCGVICLANEKVKFVIEGHLKEAKDGLSVYLLDSDKNIVGKCALYNGQFLLEGGMPQEGCFYSIKFDTISENLELFIEGSIVKISGMAKNWPEVCVSGSKSHDEYVDYQTNIQRPFTNEYRIFLSEIENEQDTIKISKAKNRYQSACDSFYDKTKDWVKSHSNSLFAPWTITMYWARETNEIKDAYNGLTKRAKNSFYGIELRNLLLL